MKKVFRKGILTSTLALMMALVMTLGAFPMTAHAATDVTITLDGRTLTQNATTGHAQIRDGRTFVPLRLVSENLNIEAFWQRDGNQMVTLEGHNRTIYHTVGQLTAFDTPSPEFGVTQPVSTTDVPSFIQDGRTMVGLRLISDAFSDIIEVDWHGSNHHNPQCWYNHPTRRSPDSKRRPSQRLETYKQCFYRHGHSPRSACRYHCYRWGIARCIAHILACCS